MSSEEAETELRSRGRICLVGEHCDWAGGYCLASSVPLEINGTWRPRDDRKLVVESALGGATVRGTYFLEEPSYSPDDPLRYAAAAALALMNRGYEPLGCEFKVEADLPPQRGLGSSAAFTILILRGLTQAISLDLSPRELAEIAYVAEHDILGIKCGLMDQTASVHDRPVFLDFTSEKMEIEELEPPQPIHLVIGDCRGEKNTELILHTLNATRISAGMLSGRPARTSAERVAYAFDDLFPELVSRGRKSLLEGNSRQLGEVMTTCQAVYDEYLIPACEELAAPEMHRLLDVCREASALGQKWTGSGGEGAFIALASDPEHQAELTQAIAVAGGKALPLTI